MDPKCICPVCQKKNTIGVMCAMVKKKRLLERSGADGQGPETVPKTYQSDIRFWIRNNMNNIMLGYYLWNTSEIPVAHREVYTIRRRSR